MIGVNLSVFSAWQYAIGSLRQFRDPQWLQFMNNNFVVSPANISEGRLITLITSAFSHLALPHLGINMIVLYSIGGAVCDVFLLAQSFCINKVNSVATGFTLLHELYSHFSDPSFDYIR